jgi:hypothetical protein
MSIMQSLALFVVVVSGISVILMLFASVVAFRMCITTKPSRRGITIATLPPLLMVGLFYSLAIHMHHTLGRWPSPFEWGPPYPPSLSAHIYIAFFYLVVIFWLSISVWPITFLLCIFVRRWRVAVTYLGLYAFSLLVCVGSMLLAPSEYLRWWYD